MRQRWHRIEDLWLTLAQRLELEESVSTFGEEVRRSLERPH